MSHHRPLGINMRKVTEKRAKISWRGNRNLAEGKMGGRGAVVRRRVSQINEKICRSPRVEYGPFSSVRDR